MKDTINYNYNLNIVNLNESNNFYYFQINKQHFYFVPFLREEKELIDIINCSKELKSRNIECHDIIYNKDSKVLTKVGDTTFVLLKVIGNINEEYTINDILDLNSRLHLTVEKLKLYQNNWPKMWSDKVDYYEYQIRELGKSKEGMLESFSYYVGLAENAISYANKTLKTLKPNEFDKVTLSHRRIFYPNIKLNYLNPLSFVFDLESRDIAEYIKSLFFYGNEEDAYADLELYLKLKKMSQYGYQMLYSRLLYPSYYFDLYEKIIMNEISEEKIINILTKVEKYEIFLKRAFKIISNFSFIEPIEWLSRKKVINLHL